jgi:NADP-dependent 3-hydroxy acid dehydrogenase YdfG
MSKVVLITGCSTGIGRDAAEHLARGGYTVVATARKVKALEGLPVALKLPLDVTQPDSVNEAVSYVLQQFGRIDVLINNAGYALRGALEEVPIEQVQQMFDVNVFGVLRLIRAVVPHMRKQRTGHIINISSIAGKLATPVNGAYSATKFAVEALSDALRVELAPFGIQVAIVEPGAIKSHFEETALARTQTIILNSASPYHQLYQQSNEFAASMRGQEAEPDIVSDVIQHAMEDPRPKARYHAAIPFSGKLVMHLGDSIWDMVLRRMFKVNPANTN